MPVPSTVAAVGRFRATRGAADLGEATLRMHDAVGGTLILGGVTCQLTGDPAARRLRSPGPASAVDLRIRTRSLLTGTVDGGALELTRLVSPPIPAAEMAQSDGRPDGAVPARMASTADYRSEVGDSTTFWYAFGPVLYRGRLDGSARVLGIASDPGPSECLPFARRALIGDSGQKTQGFLRKLGLTRSYVLVNAFAVALRPSQKSTALRVLKTNVAIRAARHALYDGLLTSNVQAIVAFGEMAHVAYDQWAALNPTVRDVPIFKVAHPAGVDRTASGHDAALTAWREAIIALRGIVTPDPDGDATEPNFGAYFTELDYARIPRWDLPAVAPAYVGDDSWGRAATPRHNNCCERPSPDDHVSLELTPPIGEGAFVRYHYRDGILVGATGQDGTAVVVDEFGRQV